MPQNPTQSTGVQAPEPTQTIPLELTDTERIAYQKCAERSGLSLPAWIRDRLAEAAKREAKQA